MIYKAVITEIRRRVVCVEADSQQAAHRRVSDAWNNCEVTLDDNDFDGVEFHIAGEIKMGDGKGLFKIERKD